MQLRTALPAAVLLGGLLGGVVANFAPEARPAIRAAARPVALIAVAEAAPAALAWDEPAARYERVQEFVDLFHQKQQDRMALYLKRSGRYEGMIREKLRARGMPEDLLYLTMIESGFNPNARSKAQAVGLWQFIQETGERYGLRVDRYVDERRDPERSTDAALRYLADLYARFGSWNLAAAAYNTGENRVGRIMRQVTGSEKGDEGAFWRIRSLLPRETRDYVPLIVAAALVGKQPEKYGLDGVERWLPVETQAVEVPGGTDLGAVARAVGLGEKEIRTLNPQLVRGVTPPGETYPVRVPVERAADFQANFERARAEHLRLAKLEAEQARAEAKLAAAKPAKAKASARAHRVRRGESLWTISRRYDVSMAALQRANGLSRRSTLQPGQKLRIPG